MTDACRCPVCETPADAKLEVAALGTGEIDVTGATVCSDARPHGDGWDVYVHIDGGVWND